MRTRKFAFEIYWPLVCALITVFDSKRCLKELLWCLWNYLTVQKVNKGDRLSFSNGRKKETKRRKPLPQRGLPISFIKRVSTQFYLKLNSIKICIVCAHEYLKWFKRMLVFLYGFFRTTTDQIRIYKSCFYQFDSPSCSKVRKKA